ncbi:hypothetical protein HIM_00090 [Hirsutella minnesotensis 3608]|nr:hypothetical protein HIM_00090 [Hirsutella minnesotensis 3608]
MAPARQQQAPQFSKDEKVLCFHLDMLYEAKIMDVQPGDKPGDGHRYKVHYKGWKNTWDDWVLADRIRPFDDEHKELAAQLHAQLKNSLQKNSKQPKKNLKNGGESARGSEERGSAAAQGGARGGRRGKDWELEQDHRGFCNLQIRFLSSVGPWQQGREDDEEPLLPKHFFRGVLGREVSSFQGTRHEDVTVHSRLFEPRDLHCLSRLREASAPNHVQAPDIV